MHIPDRLGRNLRRILNLIHGLRENGIGVKSLADPVPIDIAGEGVGQVAVLPLALFTEVERTCTAERAARPRGRRSDGPAHRPPDKS